MHFKEVDSSPFDLQATPMTPMTSHTCPLQTNQMIKLSNADNSELMRFLSTTQQQVPYLFSNVRDDKIKTNEDNNIYSKLSNNDDDNSFDSSSSIFNFATTSIFDNSLTGCHGYQSPAPDIPAQSGNGVFTHHGLRHGRVKRATGIMSPRQAANFRERRRMQTLNCAFEKLRCRIPVKGDKRMRKVDTLKVAVEYIKQLLGLLEGEELGHFEL